jgi:hypothetical protein
MCSPKLGSLAGAWPAQIIHDKASCRRKHLGNNALKPACPRHRASKPEAQVKELFCTSFACASGLNDPG